ncbi:hypothetical protein COB64_03795 [Candidatus Wolfebacteria bacterium]|nr:MAG: hypothetical protein COB64_03795 [Candidatus Wolfebacteria bacterium]
MSGGLSTDIVQSFVGSFEFICTSILVEGYQEAIKDAKYNRDWIEDSFTNYLATFMRKSKTTKEKCVFIKTQVEPENDGLPIPKTKDDPRRQPRIDFWLGSFTSPSNKHEYYVEAKNLCSSDWKKSNGTIISASYLKRRYIDTGIENFTTERYPRGCLAGYVLYGTKKKCVDGINKLLEKDGRKAEVLAMCSDSTGFEDLYISKHDSIELKHFLFEF